MINRGMEGGGGNAGSSKLLLLFILLLTLVLPFTIFSLSRSCYQTLLLSTKVHPQGLSDVDPFFHLHFRFYLSAPHFKAFPLSESPSFPSLVVSLEAFFALVIFCLIYFGYELPWLSKVTAAAIVYCFKSYILFELFSFFTFYKSFLIPPYRSTL